MRRQRYLRSLRLLVIALTVLFCSFEALKAQSPPSGPAGGDLAGTYPNPGLAVDRVRKTGDSMTGVLDISMPGGGGIVAPFSLTTPGNAGPDRGLAFHFNLPSTNPNSALGARIIAARESWGLQSYMSFGIHNGTAMTEGARITSGGRFGIGTTAPATQLHISNATAVATTLTSGYGGGLLSMQDTNGPLNSKLYQWRSEGGVFRMALLNDAWSGFVQQNIFVANSVGNIGIGTASPAYRLDVSGEINATGFRINGTPIATGGASQWNPSGASNIYYNAGNVGIGTTTPGELVHIRKDQNAATHIMVENTTAGASALADLQVKNNLGHLAQFGLYSSTTTTSGALASGNAFAYTTSPAMVIMANNATGIIKFATGGNSERMRIDASGNVGIGTTPNSNYKLDVNGSLNASGAITGGTINAKYQDVAEWVRSSQQLSAGTVVVLDHTKPNQVIASSQAYDTRVAGVISFQPGITLGEKGESKVLVATTGRVKVKVDASQAPIQIGDLLVTSDEAGFAIKSMPLDVGGVQLHRPGTLIGKALEPLAKGKGEILVLLSLQ